MVSRPVKLMLNIIKLLNRLKLRILIFKDLKGQINSIKVNLNINKIYLIMFLLIEISIPNN